MAIKNKSTVFYFKDCALSAIATGEKAQNLKELYDKLNTIPISSIYYHFWGAMLRPHYEVREYHNDFATWVYRNLHDQTLAERLAIIDPSEFEDLEELRKEVMNTIETRLDETEQIPWLPKAQQFYFARSKIIVFDTHYKISEPHELIQVIPKMTPSSIFYHFIDAYRRTPIGYDDFSAWLQGFYGKYDDLIEKLRKIDYYFFSLSELQRLLVDTFASYFQDNQGSKNNE